VFVARSFCGVAGDERLVLTLQAADRELQDSAVSGVLEDLPCPEHALAQQEALLAELFLCGKPFGVGGEVALQVRPAELRRLRGRCA